MTLTHYRAQIVFGFCQRGGAVIKAPEIGGRAQIYNLCFQMRMMSVGWCVTEGRDGGSVLPLTGSSLACALLLMRKHGMICRRQSGPADGRRASHSGFLCLL